jgi:2-polyprenyl-3-methyl-5-hydroxy-6-metoxy-1,4-benzoquinol methylase
MRDLERQQHALASSVREDSTAHEARRDEVRKRSELLDSNLLGMRTDLDRLADRVEYMATFGQLVQQLRNDVDDKLAHLQHSGEADHQEARALFEAQIRQLREELERDRTSGIGTIERALDELRTVGANLQTQVEGLARQLGSLQSTMAAVVDWQQRAEAQLAGMTSSIESAAPRAAVETQGAELHDIARRLTTVVERFSARPYMGTDVYGAAGDLTAPMGFCLNASSAPMIGGDAPTFDELFRGPPEFIAERQRVYLPFMRGRTNVVDLGSGRGEFVELLRSIGIEATGVELDARFVGASQERGLDVRAIDAFDFLAQQPDATLDAIFSAQMIEHVTPARLPELIGLCRRKLRPRGLLIAETVNPESYLALKTFYVDLTHQLPIYPQVLLQLCQQAGYLSARIFYPQGGGFSQEAYATAGEYAVVALA